MVSETYSFPPYSVRLDLDTDRLQMEVRISGRNSARISIQALIAAVAADVNADQLFLNTAYSDHADGASLFSVQMSTGEVLWQIPDVPPGGSMVIHPREKWIDAGRPYGTDDRYVVRVTYTGDVITRNASSCYEIVNLGYVALDDGNRDEAKALFQDALGTSISPNTKAGVLKSLGQIEEEQGNIEGAINHYETALCFNPKAAVKRQLAALKKRQGKSVTQEDMKGTA